MAKKKRKKTDPIVGRMIKKVRMSTRKEMELMFWETPFPVIELSGGNRLFVYGDDEGNYPGSFALEINMGKHHGWRQTSLGPDNEILVKDASIVDVRPKFAMMGLSLSILANRAGITQMFLSAQASPYSHQERGLISYMTKAGKVYSIA